jgi:hypothetical protein
VHRGEIVAARCAHQARSLNLRTALAVEFTSF